jgi:integrase
MAANPRPRGTGSLDVRTDTTGRRSWYGRYYEGNRRVVRLLGRVKTSSAPGLTRAQAEAKLRELVAGAEGAPGLGERLTIAQAGARYIEHAARRGRKRSTLMNLDSEIRVHLAPFFGERAISSIAPEDVADLVRALERTLAPKTVRNVIATLSAILRFGAAPRRRWVASNAATAIELPAVPEAQEIRYLDLDELDLVIAHAPAGPFRALDAALWRTAAMTGLRRGELLALRWSDVDWLASRIRVRRSYVRGEFGTPKSRRSTRSVPMATEVAAALEALSATTELSDDALVFGHPQTGEPLHEANTGRRFARAMQDAGLGHHRFHDLRHTFGTTMAAAGVPMRTLQEWMGHRDITTTQRYADYSPGLEDAGLVERAFSGSRQGPVRVPKSANLSASQNT